MQALNMDPGLEYPELLFLILNSEKVSSDISPFHRQWTKAAETCLFKQSNWGKWCVGLSERNVMTTRGHEEFPIKKSVCPPIESRLSQKDNLFYPFPFYAKGG